MMGLRWEQRNLYFEEEQLKASYTGTWSELPVAGLGRAV
jgi:hypothetical protein